MVDIGRVCQPCADSWNKTYAQVDPVLEKVEITYTLVSDPLHCEECEGEDANEKWDVQP